MVWNAEHEKVIALENRFKTPQFEGEINVSYQERQIKESLLLVRLG